jgi:hypothetical protein
MSTRGEIAIETLALKVGGRVKRSDVHRLGDHSH